MGSLFLSQVHGVWRQRVSEHWIGPDCDFGCVAVGEPRISLRVYRDRLDVIGVNIEFGADNPFEFATD